jgi:ABC-type transporter Mla subunit MlaD
MSDPLAPTTAAPAAPVEPPLDLRDGLRRLSTGLIAYGAIGIALSIIGLVALLYVGGRLGTLATRTTDQIEVVIATIDDASTALTDAGATAGSFATTLDQTPDTIRQAAATVTSVQTTLRSIQSTLGSIGILGSQPFGGVAAQFGKIADDLEGLDQRLTTVADALGDNGDKLRANATSLANLGHRLSDVADALRSGVVEDSLGDVVALVTVLTLVLVMWTAVPAVGGLLLGLWLRRRLEPPTTAPTIAP